MKIYIIEGGIGKNIFFSALIPKLADTKKIITIASYPEIFENNPYVHRSLSHNSQYVWEDYIVNEAHELCYFEPYLSDDLIKKKNHVIEVWGKEFSISYLNKVMFPQIYAPRDFETNVKTFRAKYGNYILVQFNGGQSPYTVNPDVPFQNPSMRKDYDFDRAQEIINLLKEKFPSLAIINYALPNEETFRLQGCETVEAPYMWFVEALKQSCGFISIDSSLQHMAAATQTKGVVLWGATGPDQWGYPIHNHLTGECSQRNPYCHRPWVRPLGDIVSSNRPWHCPNPTCVEVSPQLIVDTFAEKVVDVNLIPILEKDPEELKEETGENTSQTHKVHNQNECKPCGKTEQNITNK